MIPLLIHMFYFFSRPFPADCLPPASLWVLGFLSVLICFPVSVYHSRPGSWTPSTLSDFSPLSVFLPLLLYFSSTVPPLCHATKRSLPHTHPLHSPFTFLQAGPCCLGFTSFLAASLALAPSPSQTFPSLSLLQPTSSSLFLETDVVCQILSLLAN